MATWLFGIGFVLAIACVCWQEWTIYQLASRLMAIADENVDLKSSIEQLTRERNGARLDFANASRSAAYLQRQLEIKAQMVANLTDQLEQK